VATIDDIARFRPLPIGVLRDVCQGAQGVVVLAAMQFNR
jgi:hypothetical protein